MQKEILIARRNELAALVKKAKDNGEDASHILVEMANIGDKLKEIEAGTCSI